jgi:hypothetical protein
MPSRLIQLNGMNVNAGGLIEFRADLRMSREGQGIRRRPRRQAAAFSRHIHGPKPGRIGLEASQKADTIGRTSITSLADFGTKMKSSVLSLQRNPGKIQSFFHKTSPKYADFEGHCQSEVTPAHLDVTDRSALQYSKFDLPSLRKRLDFIPRESGQMPPMAERVRSCTMMRWSRA